MSNSKIAVGDHAARMILRDHAGEPRRPFVYDDRGTLATIGKSRAVGQIGRGPLSLTEDQKIKRKSSRS